MNPALIEQVREIYSWLDRHVAANIDSSGCNACGNCCRYLQYGHRIYITSPEMMYFKYMLKENFPNNEINSSDGVCPFVVDNKCSVRDFRFGPCRIYFCQSPQSWQNALSEQFLKKMKALSEQYEIDYRYIDISKFADELFEGNRSS